MWSDLLLLPVSWQDVSGCSRTPVDGVMLDDDALAFLCSALSGEDGTFSFPSLGSGPYTLVRPALFASTACLIII